MQTSLGNLVSNLKPDDFHNTKTFYSDSQFQLLTREGVYPHDYVQSLKSFFEKQLLPKSEFYSKLNYEDIPDEDYNHAQNVQWSELN